MVNLIYYLELRDSFSHPINIDLKLNSIGFFDYRYNINIIQYDDYITKRLFYSFTQHPLIYWDLIIYFKGIDFNLDLITNLTTHPTQKLNYINQNNKYFVYDPCMLLDKNEFSKNFKFRNISNNFYFEREICNSISYKNTFSKILIKDDFKNGFFLQNTSPNNGIYIYRILNLFLK
jgi:hypothetical protein